MSESEQAKPGAGGDPSMEDILASIRRILAEEEAPPAPSSTPSPAMPPAEAPTNVLQLDASMLIAETPSVVASPPPPEPEMSVPDPVAERALPAYTAPLETPMPHTPTLVGPEAAGAAASSMGSLVRTLVAERGMQVHSGGPTLEDIVRSELRPLLKEWLDTHLPTLVERLVRVEIERVVGRTVP